MIEKEVRTEPYPSRELLGHLCGERGKKYFPHCLNLKERYEECKKAIMEPNPGVIVKDNRFANSDYVCIFVNKSGENIALPISIDESGKISIITIKNIAES